MTSKGKPFRADLKQIGGEFRVVIVPDGAATVSLRTPYESSDRRMVEGAVEFLNKMTLEMQNIWLAQWALEGDSYVHHD